MASARQIAANRKNAQKSTGPRTAAGKAVSRFNACKHGLRAEHVVMDLEDEADFRRLAAAFFAGHRPAGPAETFLVEQMALTQWRLRRAQRLETAAFHYRLLRHPRPFDITNPSDAAKFAYAMQEESEGLNPLANLSRYEARLERFFYHALHELERLQEARATPRRPRRSRRAQPRSKHFLPNEPNSPSPPRPPLPGSDPPLPLVAAAPPAAVVPAPLPASAPRAATPSVSPACAAPATQPPPPTLAAPRADHRRRQTFPATTCRLAPPPHPHSRALRHPAIRSPLAREQRRPASARPVPPPVHCSSTNRYGGCCIARAGHVHRWTQDGRPKESPTGLAWLHETGLRINLFRPVDNQDPARAGEPGRSGKIPRFGRRRGALFSCTNT